MQTRCHFHLLEFTGPENEIARRYFVAETLPHENFFRHWRMRFFKQIVADSGRGDEALHWIGAIETVTSIEELIETDPNWIRFSAKLCSGLMKIGRPYVT